jgi:uncharacterized protein YkwD
VPGFARNDTTFGCEVRAGGHNSVVKRLGVAVLSLTVILGLAACGAGGGHKQATPPRVGTGGRHGGKVGVEPTSGLVGPAATVVPGASRIIGRTKPITPAAVRPTGAKLNGVASETACASASADPSDTSLRSISAAILCLLNAQRASHGLARLHTNPRLAKAARRMVKLMIEQRFFAHTTPGGRTLLDRIRPTGYVRGRWQLGENLAWGSGAFATPASIVNSWMHSPGHRANILHAAFKDIGIGIRLGPPAPNVSGGATYVTDFGRHG